MGCGSFGPQGGRDRAAGSQDGVVPEDADGLGALLCLQQPELHGNWLFQGSGQQLLIVMHTDAHHGCVDDRAFGDSSTQSTQLAPSLKALRCPSPLSEASLPVPHLKLRLSGS